MTHTHTRTDYLFRGALGDVDPDVAELVRHETARQARHLILIPSESTIPQAVRETLASAFHNIYAEGYPLDETRTMSEEAILDYGARLSEYRRSADERYYKGTEYANIVESLARRRVAEAFAQGKLTADQLYVNVQPLSGAPANNAVYSALLSVGDTVMGMDLIQGGHLTHGSPVNRSGKNYKIVSYGLNPDTGRIDYDEMRRLALEYRPKMIIGGYSSYPWAADWPLYREIANEVGAILLADVAHVAGLIIGGVYPNPVGIADVVTFTTHKTLAGPRGAVIITHKKSLANKIDRAVFPGEQGGPHMNQVAALAVAMKIASTESFRELQRQTVDNALIFAEHMTARGINVAYGGTDTHLFNVDLRNIVGADGTALSGDMAARILDLAGVVVNRQTIPGDTAALRPSGIRIGTPWITQRGFKEAEIRALADIIADVLLACEPFSYSGKNAPMPRAKIDFETLQQAKIRVRDLAASVGIDTDASADDYPHFYYIDTPLEGAYQVSVRGEKARHFLNGALTSDVLALRDGESQPTRLLDADGIEISNGAVARINASAFTLTLNHNVAHALAWLRSLSDGFVKFDHNDLYARLPGWVDVALEGAAQPVSLADDEGYTLTKAYFVGAGGAKYQGPQPESLPEFAWSEPQDAELKTTTLYDLHKSLGAKMVPFAGYDMPVWYSSVIEEHLAVRQRSGVFDVTHMGVFDVQGRGAADFLDAVTTNDVHSLAVGESHYTYFLGTNGIPLDDLMIYRVAPEYYLVVVNASNNDKNWAWLKAVKNGEVTLDPAHPWRRATGAEHCILRDLRSRSSGADMRVDVALQGPKSLEILLSLSGLDEDKAAVKALPWAGVTRATLSGFDLIISRTGYTGERIAYELFVHPDKAPALFQTLLDHGVTPCGLAARDSLRTEAGLPLYGHELAGDLNLNPADAGFETYVKLSKPFFVGKAAYLARERVREAEVTRFRFENKVARPAHPGDPLVDRRGRVVGVVTSCSVDSEGYQLGQAYVRFDSMAEGTPVGVYSGSAKAKALPVGGLRLGDKAPMPEAATILSRFPKKKK